MITEWLRRDRLLPCRDRFAWFSYHFQLSGWVYTHHDFIFCMDLINKFKLKNKWIKTTSHFHCIDCLFVLMSLMSSAGRTNAYCDSDSLNSIFIDSYYMLGTVLYKQWLYLNLYLIIPVKLNSIIQMLCCLELIMTWFSPTNRI